MLSSYVARQAHSILLVALAVAHCQAFSNNDVKDAIYTENRLIGNDSCALFQVSKHELSREEEITSTVEEQFPPMVVRLALFDPPPSVAFHRIAMPALAATICMAENNLLPALLKHSAFGKAHNYLIYTDNRSYSPVRKLLVRYPGLVPSGRVNLVNLDLDPEDEKRMLPYTSLTLDTVNLASLRRALADTKHLPAENPKLLIGLDVSFLKEPKELLDQAAQYRENKALYMVDEGWKYVMTGFTGPQCPGLVGDFIYASPGKKFSLAEYDAKVQWYLRQTVSPNRQDPPCGFCADTANGLHAIDQFTVMLNLAHWAYDPLTGQSGCHALSNAHYLFAAGGAPDPAVEVVHDKVLRPDGCPDIVGWATDCLTVDCDSV